MKKIVSQTIARALRITGITALARARTTNNSLLVLMFHKVNPQCFEQQILYLKEHYNPISEKQVQAYYYHDKPLPLKSVLITFDDGYLNNYTKAYPILKKHEVPATLFLTTNFINNETNKNTHMKAWFDILDQALATTKKKNIVFRGITHKVQNKLQNKLYAYAITINEKQRKQFVKELLEQTHTHIPETIPEQYQYLNWKQVKEMMPLITYGSHTHNHPIITTENTQEQEKEIRTSKETIKHRLGIEPQSFCFPNGNYDQKSIEIIKKHYKLGFSSDAGLNNKQTNTHALKRIGINEQDNEHSLAIKLTQPFITSKKGNTNMCVILVTNYYHPVKGGLTTVVSKLDESLQKKGVRTKVLAYPYTFRKIEKIFEKHYSIIHKFFVILFLATGFLRILYYKLRCQHVVVHSHSANFCARMGIVARVLSTKSVHTFLTTTTDMKENPKQGKVDFLNKIDSLIACSHALAKEVTHHYQLQKEVDVIYNAVDKQEAQKTNQQHKKKQNTKEQKILFIGNLLPVKDPLLFINAIHYLKKDMKLKADMYGTGPLEQEVKEEIKKLGLSNEISVHKPIPHNQVMNIMRRSDIFVLTSKGEGMPLTIVEAMSCGLPVVSTAVGGVPEIITDEKNGILIKNRNPQVVAKAISKALEKKHALIKQGLFTIDNMNDWDDLADNYLLQYQRVLGLRGIKLDKKS